MIRALLLAAILAGVVVVTRPFNATTVPTPTSEIISKGDVYLCFIPDMQNQTSQDDLAGASSDTSCITTLRCSGVTDCNNSVYCSQNWGTTTARILTRNLAYDLTGQYSREDWTAIKGSDPINAKPKQANHPRCDAIISLGDMNDIDDAEVGPVGPTYATLTAKRRKEVDTLVDFWQIIRASGIPFLPLIGNHDPQNVYTPYLMEDKLNFTALPFYFGREPVRKFEYGIKFATNSGKSFCVLGYNVTAEASTDVTDAMNATDTAWVRTNIGCGDGSPTIIVGHDLILQNVCDTATSVATVQGTSNGLILNDNTKSALFMMAGGHYTGSGAELQNCAVLWPIHTNFSAAVADLQFDIFMMFANVQEMSRHPDSTASVPLGITAHDGAGDLYEIVKISPGARQVTFTSWSPYWRGLDPQAGVAYTSLATTKNFDFRKRFP